MYSFKFHLFYNLQSMELYTPNINISILHILSINKKYSFKNPIKQKASHLFCKEYTFLATTYLKAIFESTLYHASTVKIDIITTASQFFVAVWKY